MGVVVSMILVVHVIVSVLLVILVLLHSGKGTGVSSMFSGVMPTAAAGTGIIEKNLDRFTIIAAVTFAVTTLLLMVLYVPGG